MRMCIVWTPAQYRVLNLQLLHCDSDHPLLGVIKHRASLCTNLVEI